MSSIQFAHPRISSTPAWRWIILPTVLPGTTMPALDVSTLNLSTPTLKTKLGAKP